MQLQETLIALLERVGDRFTLDQAKEEAQAAGFPFLFTWDADTVLYEKVWQHPGIAEYNDTLNMRSADILRSAFFTLYRIRPEYRRLQLPELRLLIGYVGNTRCYTFDAPAGAQAA